MNQKIKAALVARGLCAADASDDVAQAALTAFFAGQGKPVPSDEAATLAALAPPAPPTPPANPTPPTQSSSGVLDTQERERIAAAERLRAKDIRARGQLLGVGAEVIEAQVEAGVSVETAVMKFTDLLAGQQKPVDKNVRVEGSAVDRIVAGCTDALLCRALPELPKGGGPRQLSKEGQPFRHFSLLRVAETVLNAAGVRVPVGDNDEVACMFLRLSASSSYVPNGLLAGDSSFNTPGMFPNLMSNLAGKMLDMAVDYAESTYRQWCAQLSSVPDFKPKTIVAVGASGELPRVPDGDDFTESTQAEEASWIAVDTYGDEFKLTPMMVVNDDLDGFSELAMDKQVSFELTLNRLCVDLLTGNPNTPDGNALFSANHGNDIGAGGGAPSQSQMHEMRLKMRAQKAPGDKRRLRIGPSVVLVPMKHETVAEQVFLPLTVVPATDANINTFRGKVAPIVEPMLDDSSADKWYAIAAKERVRTIVFCHQIGFEQGKRRTYFNPKNNCQTFQIEGRFAAAIRNWRGIVRNSGTA